MDGGGNSRRAKKVFLSWTSQVIRRTMGSQGTRQNFLRGFTGETWGNVYIIGNWARLL